MADHTERSIVINADAAEVMAVISDFEHYPEWVTAAREVEVTERDSAGRASEPSVSRPCSPARRPVRRCRWASSSCSARARC